MDIKDQQLDDTYEYSRVDVAAMMNLPVSTIAYIEKAALRKLRKHLKHRPMVNKELLAILRGK